MTDIRQVSMPVLMLIGVIAFVSWATWTGATERYRIKELVYTEIQILRKEHESKITQHINEQMAQINLLEGTIRQQNEVINRIHDLLIRVRERQTYVLENLWTKDDHDNWCRQMELTHPDFKCEPYSSGNGKMYKSGGINDSAEEDIRRSLSEDPKKLWQDNDTHHPSIQKPK